MKKTLLIMILFSGFNVFGSNVIDSLILLPRNPVIGEVVKIICKSRFGTSPCELDSFGVEINNNEIHIHAYHLLGGATVPCQSTDTIEIGQLSSGDYMLYYSYYGKSDTQYYDTDTLEFLVFVCIQVNDVEKQNTVSLYPNPVKDQLTLVDIRNQFDLTEVVIIEQTGKAVCTIRMENPTNNSFDVSSLFSGVYILQLRRKDGSIYHSKLFKE